MLQCRAVYTDHVILRDCERSGASRTVRLGAVVCAAALVITGCAIVDRGDTPAAQALTPSPDAPAQHKSPVPAPTVSPTPFTRADHDRITYLDNSYDIVTLPLDEWDVRVDWSQEPSGVLLGEAVEAGDDIVVATNAGIFSEGYVPGGLLVSDGDELRAINLREGGGNFHLMPNGVFALYDDGTAAVLESSLYDPDGVLFATQSGPALLLDGEIHPAFNEQSSNVAWRSAVGVSPDGRTVYLALSNHLVTFHQFASMFRDLLEVEDALYLDGNISGLWVEGVREIDEGFGPFAGMITATPKDQVS